jgi:hypothetical protein
MHPFTVRKLHVFLATKVERLPPSQNRKPVRQERCALGVVHKAYGLDFIGAVLDVRERRA